MEDFCGQLFEFPINFPPSYPFVEDSDVSADYMQTRCPAWCDRVVLSQTAKPLISSVSCHEFLKLNLVKLIFIGYPQELIHCL